MNEMYQDVYIETVSGNVQGPYETPSSQDPLQVWIFDELAEIEIGYILIKKMNHGVGRYLITSIREERPNSPDGRQGALRRCLTVQLENDHLADALTRLIIKINAAKISEVDKAEAKDSLAHMLRLPLIAAILNGSAKELLDKLT